MNSRMNQPTFLICRRLVSIVVIANSLGVVAFAQAAGPVAPQPDDPVPLSVTPRYVYRPPSITGVPVEASELQPALGADEWGRQPPALEKPDNWACRTSNNLSRSSIGKNPDGKTISDIQGLLPKC
jgi:hypothetical protein